MTDNEIMAGLDSLPQGMNGRPECIDAAIARIRDASEDKEIIARLQKLVDDNLEHTADGKLVVETDKLYCPKCAGEVRKGYDLCYCDECPNPDSFGERPLPLMYGSTFSSRHAAIHGKEIEPTRVQCLKPARCDCPSCDEHVIKNYTQPGLNGAFP